MYDVRCTALVLGPLLIETVKSVVYMIVPSGCTAVRMGTQCGLSTQLSKLVTFHVYIQI
jgi:hypothetical protein